MGAAARVAVTLLAVLLVAERAHAFRLISPFSGLSLEVYPRWPAAPVGTSQGSLQGGIDVCVASGFAEALGATTPQEVTQVEGAVRAAFAAWRSPVVRFDVDFDCVVSGEMVLGWVNLPSLPVFAFTNLNPYDSFPVPRLLTNGQIANGYVIQIAGIYLNLARVLPLAATLTPEQRLAALQRLIMHEAGHSLGIEHPGGSNTYDWAQPNLDRDTNPFNPMPIDWLDPFAGIVTSPNYDPEAIMMRELTNYAALFHTELRHDDRAARDVLYPLPPPDNDNDGITDSLDNCPVTPNAAQTDGDSDGIGDACVLAAGDVILNGADGLVRLQPGGGAAPVVMLDNETWPIVAFDFDVDGSIVALHGLDGSLECATHLSRIHLRSGARSSILADDSLELSGSLVVEPDGQILVPRGCYLSRVHRIHPVSGAASVVADPLTLGFGFTRTHSIARDPGTGAIFASFWGDPVFPEQHWLYHVAPVTNALTLWFFTSEIRGMLVEPSGSLVYLTEYPLGVALLYRVTAEQTGELVAFESSVTPTGLVRTSDARLLLADADPFPVVPLRRVEGTGMPSEPSADATVDPARLNALRIAPATDGDSDADGVTDANDVCARAANPDQRDSDGQGGGDVCDPCPLDPGDHCARASGAAASLGPAGGPLVTPSGDVTLFFPPGALAAETSIAISDTATDLELAGGTPGLVRIELSPEGQTFAAPVTVVLRWNDANADGVIDPPVTGAGGSPVLESDLRLLRNGVPLSATCSDPQHALATCTTSCCNTVDNLWTFQITSFSEYRLDAEPDGDLDLIANASDNCPFVRNPSQSDSDLDGTGDACECGDANDSGAPTAADVTAIRQALTLAAPLVTPGKCNVHGASDPLLAEGALAPNDCAIDDVVVLRRALESPALDPGIAPTCAGAPVAN